MAAVANDVTTEVKIKKPTRRRVARPSRVAEGLPDPLGATWDGLGVRLKEFMPPPASSSGPIKVVS